MTAADETTALVVGMDVGGTKAAVRATDAAGRVVADVGVGSAEWDAEPAEAAAAWLEDVLARALPSGAAVGALAIGAQGLDRPEVARSPSGLESDVLSL